jgi:hypothetical protein
MVPPIGELKDWYVAITRPEVIGGAKTGAF